MRYLEDGIDLATPYFNVKDAAYGAVGDGSTNDTTAIQAAFNAVPSSGGIVYFPPGIYSVPSGGLTCSNPVIVQGSGVTYQDQTKGAVLSTSATNAALLSLSAPGSYAQGMTFYHATSGTRSSGLIGLSMTNVNFSGVRNCMFNGFSTNLKMASGVYWSVTDCIFRDFVLKGIDASYSSGSTDVGNPRIIACEFDRTSAAVTNGDIDGIPIYCTNIGGVTVVAPMIEGQSGTNGFAHGILFEVADTKTSTILNVTGGVIEGVKVAAVGVVFAAGATSGTLNSVTVTGVEMNGLNNSGSIGVLANNPTINSFNVTGCSFNLLDHPVEIKNVIGGSVSGNSSRGLVQRRCVIGTGCNAISIGGNEWDVPTAPASALAKMPIIVRRTTDSTPQTANTTVTSDDQLLFNLDKNDVMMVEAVLIISAANATMDFKCQWAVPGGAATGSYYGAMGIPSNNMASFAPTTSGNTPISPNLATGALAVATNTAIVIATFGLIVAGDGTTSGNVVLQWAQNTSDAGALKLMKNSFLRITPLVA